MDEGLGSPGVCLEGVAAAGALVLPFGALFVPRGCRVTAPKRSPQQAPGALWKCSQHRGGFAWGDHGRAFCSASTSPAAFGAGTSSCCSFHPVPSALSPLSDKDFFF